MKRRPAALPRRGPFVFLWGWFAHPGSFHGARYAFVTIFAASASPVISSFAGSQVIFLPARMAMLPRWHTVAERWPISTSQIGSFRLLMQSSQLAWWFLLTYSLTASAPSGWSSSSFGFDSILPRVTKIDPL